MKTHASKILIFLLAIILFLPSCKKEKPATTYQIVNNMTPPTNTFEYLNGTLWEIVVFCYQGNDIVRQDNIDEIAVSKKGEVVEVSDNIEKVKVSFKLIPDKSQYADIESNVRKYVVSFTVLTKETNNIITIDDHTMIRNTISELSPEKSITMGLLNQDFLQ